LRQGEDFEEFYRASYGRVVAVVAAVLGDRHEAEEAAQEAFARALARWPRLSQYDLPEAWIRRVALRIAIDSGRRRRSAVSVSGRLRSLAARRAGEPEPTDSLALSATGRAIMRLPLREREVLVLHYVADLSVQQIATDLGLPAGTVKARLAAGRRRLESELAVWAEGGRDA
jgi:RNA polymerase sigma-70 factor, ECF subfamily